MFSLLAAFAAGPLPLHSQDFGDVKSEIPAESLGAHENDYPTAEQVQEKRVALPKEFRSASASPVRLASPLGTEPPIPSAAKVRHQKHAEAAVKAKLRVIPDHYIVAFKKGTFPYEMALSGTRDSQWYDAKGRTQHQRTEQEVAALGGELTDVFTHGSGAFAAYFTPQQAKRMAALPFIERVEPEHILYLNATTFPAFWGTDRINRRDPTLDGNRSWNADGTGVHVYIVDTGIRGTHQEFSGRVGDGYCSVVDPTDPLHPKYLSSNEDLQGHGTHVAGISCGATVGVARKAIIHSVRIAGAGGIDETSLLHGLNWISQYHQDPAVVNMSLGGAAAITTQEALTEVINGKPATASAPARTPVTVIAAAGNGLDNDSVGRSVCQWPANVPPAITVGATGATDATGQVLFDGLPSYSNYGPMVDVWAPGSQITSAWYTSDSATHVDIGTSMAAPFVAGTAALYLQTHPHATPVEVRNSIVANGTRRAIPYIAQADDDATYGPNRLLYIGNEWLDNDRIVVDGSGRLVLTNALSGGYVYDQVLLTGQSVRVHADEGQIVRVSYLDFNDDIIQVEFSGCGNLVVSLAPGFSGPAVPAKYSTQYFPDGTPVKYMKGTASFRIEAPSENSNCSIHAVGPANSTSGTLFPAGMLYDGRADVALLDFWNPNVGTEAQNRMQLGSINHGNAKYQGTSGQVGIRAGLVDVKYRAVVGDIKASGSAVPYFEFGRRSTLIGVAATNFSDLGRPIVAGGDLIQPNGKRVIVAENSGNNSSLAGFSEIWTNGNYNANLFKFDSTRPHIPVDPKCAIPAQALTGARLARDLGSSLTPIRMSYVGGNGGAFPLPPSGLTAP